MSSRTRTRGSGISSGWLTNTGGTEYQVRRIAWWGDPQFEYRTIDLNRSRWTYYDDRESITDVVGKPELYNAVSHTALQPIQIGTSLAKKETEEMPGYMPLNVWKTLKQDIGRLRTSFSWNDSFDPTYTMPSFGGASIDWTSLVNSVGNKLDGAMDADMNILVTLAESAKTIKMVKSPYSFLKGGWRKTAKHLSAKTLCKSGADVWLSWRYGWTQLYRDITALAAIKRRVQDHIKYIAQTQGSWASIASSQIETYDYSPRQDAQSSSGFWFEPTVTATRTGTFSLDIWRSDMSMRFSTFELVLQAAGVYDVLYALWDLVPFSFIVDWFIDIGNWLSSSPVYWNRFKLRKMGYSTKTEYACKLKVCSCATNWQGPSDVVEYESPETVGYKTYYRTPGFPPDTSGVGLFGGLTLTHLADAAAIIAQRT